MLIFFTLFSAGFYAFYTGAIHLPERYKTYNPWEPLDVAAQPNWLTAYKLAKAISGPDRCLSALAGAGMNFDLLPDRMTGRDCGFENAVRVRSAGVQLGGPLTLSCPMALTFAMWERHSLQPAAQKYFGEPVAAIEHLGSYACRNINTGEGTAPNAPPRKRSRHATADALDVSSLRLADGKRISVLNDFQKDGDSSTATTPEAALLRDLHAGACRYFDGVLGPDFNAVHRDHFHLETGGYSMCR